MSLQPDYRKSRWRISRRAKWIFFPIFGLAILNFIAFSIAALYLGGDAFNGYAISTGHYFLSSHGHQTEVSHAIWTYSYIHAISVWITHGLVFVALAILIISGDMALEKV
ncbi:hypothetical protein BH09VER1_BH09VER1_00930 [soil metagenome]